MGVKKCGCYDGVYSKETPTILVSVRCLEHLGTAARAGHSLMHYNKKGEIHSVAASDQHSAKDMALAKTRRTNAARSRKFAENHKRKAQMR